MSQYVLIHFLSIGISVYRGITQLLFQLNGSVGMGRWKEIGCVLGSGERRLFIVVVVTCMKGLPCSFVETTSVTLTDTGH